MLLNISKTCFLPVIDSYVIFLFRQLSKLLRIANYDEHESQYYPMAPFQLVICENYR